MQKNKKINIYKVAKKFQKIHKIKKICPKKFSGSNCEF